MSLKIGLTPQAQHRKIGGSQNDPTKNIFVYITRYLRAVSRVCAKGLVALGGVHMVVAVSSQFEQDQICNAMGGIPAVLDTYRLDASILSLFTFELFT